MSDAGLQDKLQDATSGAFHLSVVVGAIILVLVLYLVMAFLVYRQRLEDGPLILFTGVILGYLLGALR